MAPDDVLSPERLADVFGIRAHLSRGADGLVFQPLSVIHDRRTVDPPWLTARLPTPHRMLSWAPHNPGFVTADTVTWREVRDADLTEDFDALSWLSRQPVRAGRGRVRRPDHVPRSGPISSRNRMFGSNFRKLSGDGRAHECRARGLPAGARPNPARDDQPSCRDRCGAR
jgi:hypothetical protein